MIAVKIKTNGNYSVTTLEAQNKSFLKILVSSY